ncbi:MAG: hypothetical protein Ct9H300mP11_25800 [Chloroflexota bacterium]|nr:MAG: hypothetical protein Ct9H300mP11_25800 [Chloroflexota bacterium]
MVTEALSEDHSKTAISEGFKAVFRDALRGRILKEHVRSDGRALDQVRPISCDTGLLPRAHGTGLFTRGETQVMSIVTVGSLSLKQTMILLVLIIPGGLCTTITSRPTQLAKQACDVSWAP